MNSIYIIVAFLASYIVLRISFERRYRSLHRYYTDVVAAIAAAIDARDASTLGHTERVTDLSMKVADELAKSNVRINRKFMYSLQIAALLHDIGKIGISEQILNKPGPPTQDEWVELKKHPSIGAHMLEPLRDMKEVTKAVRYHQEHYDGRGYPEQLKADDIPLMSRIIMVVDAFDSIISDRPYRTKMPKSKAIKEIKKFSGTQFDPKVVEAFLRVVGSK